MNGGAKLKKIKYLLLMLISIFMFDITVFAATGNISVSSSNVYVGDSFTVSVNVNASAAWNIHVVASGPVSGCTINQANATDDAMDTNITFNSTCTATGEGTISINLSGDVTSATDGKAVSVSGSKAVTVTTKPAPPSENQNETNSNQPPQPVNRQDDNNVVNNNQQQSNNIENNVDNKSSNNNIKELIIEGHELVKVDDNNYILNVSNDVDKLNVKAIPEDTKATITGDGIKEIKVGENDLEIIVTSESGIQNKIYIKVMRKDGFYLEDLPELLSKRKENIEIIIKSDTVISLSDLEKIKDSKKIVKFNYFDESKKLVYSWIIDGSKLKNINDQITTISYDSENKNDILRLSNYAYGMFISFKQKENYPEGARIKLYVGDKYSDNDLLNVYGYVKENDKLDLLEKSLKVEDGYIEFDLRGKGEYFVTMSTIPNIDKVSEISNSTHSNKIIISIIILLIILFIIIIALKNKSRKEKGNVYYNNIEDKTDINSTISNENKETVKNEEYDNPHLDDNSKNEKENTNDNNDNDDINVNHNIDINSTISNENNKTIENEEYDNTNLDDNSKNEKLLKSIENKLNNLDSEINSILPEKELINDDILSKTNNISVEKDKKA